MQLQVTTVNDKNQLIISFGAAQIFVLIIQCYSKLQCVKALEVYAAVNSLFPHQISPRVSLCDASPLWAQQTGTLLLQCCRVFTNAAGVSNEAARLVLCGGGRLFFWATKAHAD